MNIFISIVAAIAMMLVISTEKDARAEEKHDQEIKVTTTTNSYNPYTTTPVV